MSYFHCGNGYPDRCNGYVGPLDSRTCTNGPHRDRSGPPTPWPSPEEQAQIDRFGIFAEEAGR